MGKKKREALEAELKKVREELEQARREHYRGTQYGQFGFAARHYTIENGRMRWLD